jgi:hypothetical protein
MKREVMEPEGEKVDKIALIDEYLHNLETEQKYDTDLFFRMEFYSNLKQILNIRLRNDDEKEMLVFIKTHEFIKKEDLYAQLKKIRSDLPPKVIHTMVLSKFNKMVCVDIAARMLIVLQTSKKEYLIKSNFCGSNYMGFPLVNDVNESNGINLIYCLFNQLSKSQKYNFLQKGMEKIFIDRLFYFIENDEFIKNKINQAIDEKSNRIFNVLNFDLYENNLWRDFLPHMTIILDWKPDKKLLKGELKDIKGKNYKKMLDVADQNIFHMSYQIIFLINKIIDTEIVRNKFFKTTHITNSCCLDLLNIKSGITPYYSYFKTFDKDIQPLFDELDVIIANKNYIKDKTRIYLTKLETTLNINKTLKQFPLHFKMESDELQAYFLKYIDEGPSIGKEHIYNNFGVCMLSNVLKEDIESTSYSIHEFNKLKRIVYQKNIIYSENDDNNKHNNKHNKIETVPQYTIKDIETNKVLDFTMKDNAIIVYDYILDAVKNHKKLSIFKNNIQTIKKNIVSENDDKREDNLNNWGRIISQTVNDINTLVKGITTKKNEITEFTKGLTELCEYNKLYEQEIEKTNDDEQATHFKYIKKENELKRNYEFLLTSVCQIKNNKFKYEKRIDNIRTQFQYLYPFKEETGIFKELYDIINLYKKIFKNIKGQNNTYLTAENVSTIFHYLLIHCLLMILNNYKDDTKQDTKQDKQNKEDDIKANKVAKINSSIRKMQDYESDEGGYIDSEDYEVIKTKKKGNNTFYVKTNFLTLYIKYIINNHNYFDNLTDSLILERRSTFEQKQQRRNLKMLHILKTEEGMEEYRGMVLAKLKFGMMEYGKLEQQLEVLGITQDEEYDNDIVEKDYMDDNEFYNKEKNTDNILDPDFNDGNIVYASDDDDAEDADYIL